MPKRAEDGGTGAVGASEGPCQAGLRDFHEIIVNTPFKTTT
jgi:hypothetical protein